MANIVVVDTAVVEPILAAKTIILIISKIVRLSKSCDMQRAALVRA